MKKVLVGITTLIAFIFTGCGLVYSGSPTSDMLLYRHTSSANVTANFKEIPKGSKIFIKDATKDIDLDNSDKEDLAYSLGVFSPLIQCSPAVDTKKILATSGYQIVSDIKNSKYVIIVENLGCGFYGEIKDHFHNPTPINKVFVNGISDKKFDDNFKRGKVQNTASIANLSSTLSKSGHNVAGGALGAIDVLSLFSNNNKRLFAMDSIFILNKKTKKVEHSYIYTFSPVSGSNTISYFFSKMNMEIAKRIQMEIGG